jgi:tRNA(adenine34) deaminase
MRRALAAARSAGRRGEVPVGAVVVRDGDVIASASNRMEGGGDATLHAEMVALRKAALASPNWRLSDLTLYVTLEPCPMCAGAMVQARLKRVVYGARDPKKGADGSVYDLLQHSKNNWKMAVTDGVCADECGALLADFFKQIRKGT